MVYFLYVHFSIIYKYKKMKKNQFISVSFSVAEKNALIERLNTKNKSWSDYIKKINKTYMKKHVLSLRYKIILYIKSMITDLKDFVDIRHPNIESGSFNQSDKSNEESKNREGNLENSQYIKSDNKNMKYIKYSKIKNKAIFILDFGSVNPTSNSDLTLMNFKSIKIIDKIIDKINEEIVPKLGIKYSFTRQKLSKIFDINFFVNSFLFVKDGYLVLMHCDDEDIRKKQRLHSKYRIQNTESIKHIKHIKPKTDLEKIILERNALIKKDDCLAIELTSKITYFVSDAYHSQGAFTHVLLEIQHGKNGNTLGMRVSDYLDSCFDNLGLLKNNIVYKSRNIDKYVNKYCTRIVHALKRINEEKKDLELYILEIVKYINENTEYNKEIKYLPYSIGKYSDIKKKENNEKEDFLQFFHSRTQHFNIRGRKLKSNISKKLFVRNIYEKLLSLEKKCDMNNL